MSARLPLPLTAAAPERLRAVEIVLTDMDDTLTHHGRLPVAAYAAMDALRQAGIRVIPVTAAPAGWADQMVRMWPVDAVIAENGGVSLHQPKGASEPSLTFWHEPEVQTQLKKRLDQVSAIVLEAIPGLTLAGDQPFRLTSLGFRLPSAPEHQARLQGLLRDLGCATTINNLWVLAWFGSYSKLEASRRLLTEQFGIGLDSEKHRLLYSGDSLNDEPMFAALPNSVGVSTVVDYLPRMTHGPHWITTAPGGLGFAELAETLLAARG